MNVAVLRRRVWPLLAVLALTAAACGSDEPEAEPDESATDSDAAADSDTDSEVAGELSVAITWSGSELEAFEAVIEGFEEVHPDVDISLLEIPFEELNAQLTQQFAAGSPPDVTVALPGLIRLFAAQDFLMPLDDLWDEWVASGQYNDSLRAIASADGTGYGAWFKGNVNGLIWYKPDQLDELGVGEPSNWDEWLAGLDAISTAGVDPFAVGGADSWPLTQWWDPILVRVAGPDVFNGLIDGSVPWDDPGVVESFEVLGDLVAEYFPPTTLDRGFVDATCAWAEGAAAYQNQGAFVNLVARGECDPDMEPGEDYTFFLMPPYDEAAPEVQFISGDLFAVAADTQNPDAALALVRYLASEDAQTIWAELGGFVAPNAEVPLEVYPDENDRMAAELWPADTDAQAVYDLDDFIGGQIQSTLREALQQFVRDQDVERIVETMMSVDEQVRG